MKIKYYLNKIKDVGVRDYISVFPMLGALCLLPFFKRKYSDTWVICERKDEARDNGYHFFKYIVSTHPEQDCIYYISKKCKDYEKVKDLGKVEKFGGIRHWIAYFSARFLISSQAFAPNGYVCAFLERNKLFLPNHVFLQHGITINKAAFLLASRRNVKYFITGAKPEDIFVKEYFGYPDEAIIYTGFPRFDALHDFKTVPGRILIMPTWRKWLNLKSERHSDADIDLKTSEYLTCWKSLTNNEELKDIIKKSNLEVLFYPHPNMKKLINIGDMTNEYVHSTSEDIQDLLKTSQLLITDYSSVFFDMAYMKKPVIFYQFDEQKFRKYHYAQGWFDYQDTAFGRTCLQPQQVVEEIKKQLGKKFLPDEEFLKEHQETFLLYDEKNSERIFRFLIKKQKNTIN